VDVSDGAAWNVAAFRLGDDARIETDEKMATDLAGPGYHINRSNLLVLESKADMQKRGQASPTAAMRWR
jgi:hypothetical protein